MKKHLFFMLAFAVVAFTPIFAQNAVATIDDYYPQGTKWTELRMPEDYDNTNDSWYLEKYVDGVLTWVPNYEVVNFYVEGDTVNSYGEHLYVVYKDTKKSKHLRAFYLGMKEIDGESTLCATVCFAFLGGILELFPSYNFENWNIGKKLWFGFPTKHLYTCGDNSRYFGPVPEIKRACLGGVRELDYFEGNVTTGKNGNTIDIGDYKIVKGIGITSSIDRDCIFFASSASIFDEENLKYMPEYADEVSHSYSRSILVHFERDGEVLYDQWPTPDGSMAQHVQDVLTSGSQDNSAVYDLQGRKVEGKPSRGIYIIGGKKRVVE